MDHIEFKRMLESFGITDRDFINGVSFQLINADCVGGDGLEFAASVIKGIRPRDQSEVMLAEQMAVTHMATMKFLKQLGASGDPRTVTKLATTYTHQMLTLKRYRTGGEQKVTVQHVSIADGGQAIVGPVTHNALEQPADKPAALIEERQPAPQTELSEAELATRDYEARHPEIAEAREKRDAARHARSRGARWRRR